MSKRSGEQMRRLRLQASLTRYAQIQEAKDKFRMVKALRDIANRLEAEAKGQVHMVHSARPKTFAVTDHAVCRFLERVMGIDLDGVRAQIARAVPLDQIPSSAAGIDTHSIYVRDGFQFLLTPCSVISVLAPHMDGSGWLTADETALVEAL